MEDFIASVFMFNAVITLVAYVPQITKLISIKVRPKNFSVMSWLLWSYSAGVALVYAVVNIGDWRLIAINGLSLACVLVVLVTVLYKNQKYK